MAKFKPGDVVQLNSGGPKMTVDSSFKNGDLDYTTCVWYEGSAYQTQDFIDETLKVYVEEPLIF